MLAGARALEKGLQVIDQDSIEEMMLWLSSLVGTGRAAKQQIEMMVRHLLPTADPQSADAADALAVAICHAHHNYTGAQRVASGVWA